MPAYHMITFGCQMNVNDSAWLGRSLQQRGFVESPLADADVVILNTCSVRDKPEQKVYAALGRIREETRSHPHTSVVVAGCVAQQIGDEFFKRFQQVRLVVGGDGMSMAPDAIERLWHEPTLRLNLTDFSEVYPERDPALPDISSQNENIIESAQMPPVGYVNIMQGCDNFCAYCIVPFTRGRQKSRQKKAILEECQKLVNRKTQDITLLGQNVNAYGRDTLSGRKGDTSFTDLVRQVSALLRQDGTKLERLRFVTPHPKDFGPDVVALFGELENLCPRLHLPMQAGSDRVLSRMGRRYDMEKFLRLVESLRAACPDIALSTDIIVGFPGETEAQFQETLDAVDAVRFMSSYSFCYSDRPGTAASRHEGKIDPKEKAQRLERLQARQEILSARWLESRVGRETDVLLEGMSRKQDTPLTKKACVSWQGRDPWGDPVNVALPEGVHGAGLLLPVRITAAKRHSLMAEVLSKEMLL